jgi:trehalose 6-phosphate synthase/phosphatase
MPACRGNGEQCVVRHEQHFRYIKDHSVHAWANNFLSAFQNVCEDLASMKTYGLGFGLGFRVVALQPHFRHLDVAELVAAMPGADNACFLLDYDGTLTTEVRIITRAAC